MLSKSQLAIIYMIASVACFSIMDIIVKYLKDVPFGQVLFMRFAFGMIPIILLIPREKVFTFTKLTGQDPRLRASWGAIVLLLCLLALETSPLLIVYHSLFLGPVFVTILSALFLGENIRMTKSQQLFLE